MLVGNLAEWLPHFKSLEKRVLDAVEAAWPNCVGPLQCRKNALTHEDHITEHLVHAIIRTKGLPGRIIYQYTLLSEADDGYVSISSNIDFVLTIGDDEDVYLACECKRLNVPYGTGVRGLVGPYVDEGLMRFVTGQYASGLPVALMIGYVMNARSDRAGKGVQRAMAARSVAIGLQSQRSEPHVLGRALRLHSLHTCQSGDTIEVAHTLLPWP